MKSRSAFIYIVSKPLPTKELLIIQGKRVTLHWRNLKTPPYSSDQSNINSNGTNQHHVSCDVYSELSTVLLSDVLPKVCNLIMSKYQANLNRGTFYNIMGL